VELQKAVDGGKRLWRFGGLVVRIRLVQLRLLSQRCAGSPAFELVEQHDRFVVGAGVQFILGLGVNLVRAPAGR
jgi:hypothetical protein